MSYSPALETIAQYRADMNVRAVQVQANGKIDVKASYTIIGPSGSPEMPPFGVSLAKRTGGYDNISLSQPTGAFTFNAVDGCLSIQVVARARANNQSFNVGISQAYQVCPRDITRMYPTQGQNYVVDIPISPYLASGGIYRYSAAISGAPLIGMTNYTPTQEAQVSTVQQYITTTLSNIPYETSLVTSQPTGSQTLPPPPAHTVSPGSAISPAEQAARPLPTSGQIMGGISAGTLIGAGILGYFLLRRKR